MTYIFPDSTTIFTPLSDIVPLNVKNYSDTPIIYKMKDNSILYPNMIYPSTIYPNTPFNPSDMIYSPNIVYDPYSNIGKNPVVRYEINRDMRYEFLDKWLYKSYPEILKNFKYIDNRIQIIPIHDIENNDIKNDTEKILMLKSDYIACKILTLKKNNKILEKFTLINNIQWYNLYTIKRYIKKAQSKYIKRKIKRIQEKLFSVKNK